MQYKGVEIYQTGRERDILREKLREIKDLEGEIVEVGVYAGGTAAIIREEIKDKELYLFDTYSGLPDKINKKLDPESYYVGHCGTPKSFVEELMKDEKNVFIVEGVFPDTADIIKDKKFAFAHIDTDIYQSTKDSLEYLYPRMTQGGYILIHDYPILKGVAKAVDEFLEHKEETVEKLGIEGRQGLIRIIDYSKDKEEVKKVKEDKKKISKKPSKKTNKKQIIVLGIYRSGTSLITGTLHHLGIDVGRHENLTHPTKNPKGFWECEDCMEVSVKLRKLCGDKTVYNVDRGDIHTVIDNESANKIVKEYIDKRNTKDVWAVKDPKMLPFFELFLKYLDNPYIIFIRRNKDSVIKSWQTIKPSMANMIPSTYERHLDMMDKYLSLIKGRKIPYLEIDYTEHINDPLSSAQKMADFVGVENNPKAAEFCNTYSVSKRP